MNNDQRIDVDSTTIPVKFTMVPLLKNKKKNRSLLPKKVFSKLVPITRDPKLEPPKPTSHAMPYYAYTSYLKHYDRVYRHVTKLLEVMNEPCDPKQLAGYVDLNPGLPELGLALKLVADKLSVIAPAAEKVNKMLALITPKAVRFEHVQKLFNVSSPQGKWLVLQRRYYIADMDFIEYALSQNKPLNILKSDLIADALNWFPSQYGRDFHAAALARVEKPQIDSVVEEPSTPPIKQFIEKYHPKVYKVISGLGNTFSTGLANFKKNFERLYRVIEANLAYSLDDKLPASAGILEQVIKDFPRFTPPNDRPEAELLSNAAIDMQESYSNPKYPDLEVKDGELVIPREKVVLDEKKQ